MQKRFMIQKALLFEKKFWKNHFFSRKTIKNTRKRRFVENLISWQNVQAVCNTQREREIIIQKKSQQKKRSNDDWRIELLEKNFQSNL